MMHRWLMPLILGWVVVLVGCRDRAAPHVPAADQAATNGDRIQFPLDDEATSTRLPFTITVLYAKQRPSATAPFHEDGGEWTFFDCQADANRDVKFTVGVKSERSGDTIAWGSALLIVPDRAAGERFVALFAKSFAATGSMYVDNAYEPPPLPIDTAILGENLSRQPSGGFGGTGNWTATKWFPEFEGHSGEVFFNYNLVDRRGEFSEKDEEYADDLVLLFEAALRDGPRPPRTPETDPNLTLVGPRLGAPRKLLSRHAHHHAFSSDARFAVYQDGARVLALALDQPDAAPRELARFDNAPWEWRVVGAELNLLVQEGVSPRPGRLSSADPMRFWWVNGADQQKTLIREPEVGVHLSDAPLAPGGRYVALEQWRGEPGTEQRSKQLILRDREAGKEHVLYVEGEDLTVVDWRGAEGDLRAVVVTNRWQFDGGPSKMYLADPAAGQLIPQPDADARADLDNLLSPDGKHRVRLASDSLVFTDTATGTERTFQFHADDLAFLGSESVGWVGSQYVRFNGQRLALIHVGTLKMNFPSPPDWPLTEPHVYRFSTDLRWTLFNGEDQDGSGLFLAPVLPSP